MEDNVFYMLQKSGRKNWFIENERYNREVIKLLQKDKSDIAAWLTSPDDKLRKIAERANESKPKNTKSA